KKVADKQEETLASLLAGKLDNSVIATSPLILYPCGSRRSGEDEILLLMRSGIYSYKLYGGETECILDGDMYSISDVDKEFAGMAVTEGETGRIFYILYSDGKLMRYVMDETLPAEPESCLRVYSLYEDGNIRQAVSAFRRKYPELSIRYEVGVKPDYGMTEEDALRNLSTELSAGTGPDILVMDDLPIDSYIEKGVLEDLSSLRETMPEEEYFMPVIDGFASEAGQYVMPLTFAVPALGGDAEKIQAMEEIQSLQQLAQELEKAAGAQEGSVIGTRSAEETLRLFAQSSMGAWMTEDGTLDRVAVEDFLTQVKRIYDLQMERLPEGTESIYIGGTNWGNGENVLVRKHGSHGLSGALSVKLMFPEQPFYAGYLSSAWEDYPLAQGQLDYVGGSYRMMPGQNYGTCLPVSLMAMNSASQNKENCRLFLTYIFSQEFQGSTALSGTPVNKSAYQKRQANPKEDSTRTYMHFGYST
ncbi:MAG: extracellular solute-binding protein, partial [Acetatifactor sp.]|nr:extracellular solute-binding protein [Acetatifactor sp.]